MQPPSLCLLATTALVIIFNIETTNACLCSLLIAAGKFTCPAPPTCCESGQYAFDECGCCQKCAKAELQTCGGASDISGRCAAGLQCLKTCLPCKTVGSRGKPCIFPFKYAGSTYDKCTARDSDAGQPWCATEIDEEGYVVDNAWGDCLEGCPGTRLECDDKYFSIQEGKCIDVSVPGAIPNWFGAPVVKLLEETSDLFPAPVCRNKGAAVRLYDNTCRCARGLDATDYGPSGQPRGNCTGLEDDQTDNLDKVWCFLENIRDPRTPKSGCYPDVTWSERDGRYWSSMACFESPDIEGGVKTSAGLPRPSGLPKPSGLPRPASRNPSSTLQIIEKPRSLENKQRNKNENRFLDLDDFTQEKSVDSFAAGATTPSNDVPIPLPNIPAGDQDDFTSVLNTIFSFAN
eukprot:TRINITY_DN9154_c0_g1_i1.p1 TRINITY_DN9154_c0_g1~~TRINITY_DN9154_c0_g1_i1.p1  ORF type:complete len:403 (-),score=92.87 TRINITY_DN9154_c0_g1_i1:93-1301(-)